MPAPDHRIHSTAEHDRGNRGSPARRRRLGAALALAPALALAVAAGASAAPSLQITGAGPSVTGLSTPDHLAQTLLGPGVALEGPATINGSADPADYDVRLPALGRFTAGAGDVGIDEGLVIAANSAVTDFAGASAGIPVAGSATDPDLFDVVTDAGLCPGPTLPAGCVYSATSLEFAVRPTSRYIKFEYALAITESGLFAGPDWQGNVFYYPDGFALLVGGRSVAHNCAVVPQTSTYLTMQTAGIVAPFGSASANRAAAQANLDARIADPAAPNGFAYQTDPGWAVRFLTVPLTCVADVNDAYLAGDPAGIKIVVANIGDSAVPPAVFLKGGSVRFSDDSTPAPAPAPAAPSAPAAPHATGGDSRATVTWTAPDDDGGAPITAYTVTSHPDGRTCTVSAPATSCVITGLTNGTPYTFSVVATNSVGDGAASSASSAVTPHAPARPPAPTPTPTPAPTPAPAPPAAPSPAPPAAPPAPIVTPIAPPVSRPAAGAGEPAARMVHRLQFDEVGRYTFIYVNRATGKRIAQLRGSRVGARTIARRASAPVLDNRRAGRRLVVNSLLAKRLLPSDTAKVALRIVLRRPDGTLSAVAVGPDGTLGPAPTELG